MTNSISRTYDSAADARSVVSELKAIGINEDDISVIARDDHHELEALNAQSPDGNGSATNGAGIGGIVGGVVGMLAGLGLMAIPGIGRMDGNNRGGRGYRCSCRSCHRRHGWSTDSQWSSGR